MKRAAHDGMPGAARDGTVRAVFAPHGLRMIERRRLLALRLPSLAGIAALAGVPAAARSAGLAGALPFPGEPTHFRTVDAERGLEFPRDFGAHRGFRIEWWYLTGWLFDAQDTASALGFQATFFRIGTSYPRGNPSRFAPTDLIAAHAALMNPASGHPLKAELLVNAGGAGIVLDEADTHLRVGDWSIERAADDRYRCQIKTREFSWDLTLSPRHAPDVWLQGERGYSRKGPLPSQASHYYSRPQLLPRGRVAIGARSREVSGIAWFDHEWSSTLLADEAGGWDWAGLNLHDGRSVVWFMVRDQANGEPIQTYAAIRSRSGQTQRLAPTHPRVLQRWTSAVTGTEYPIAIALAFGTTDLATDLSIELLPLMADQEIDSRATTGNVYWEGAVRVLDAAGTEIGLGYLELTGYHRRIRI